MKFQWLFSAGFNGFGQIRGRPDDHVEKSTWPFRITSFVEQELEVDDVAIVKTMIFFLASKQITCNGNLTGDARAKGTHVITAPEETCGLAFKLEDRPCVIAACEAKDGKDASINTSFAGVDVWKIGAVAEFSEWKPGPRLSSEFPAEGLRLTSNDDVVIAWNKNHVSVVPNPCMELPTGIVVSNVGVGKEHVALLTEDGRVFTWGKGGRGALGHGDLASLEEPHEVESLSGMRVTKIACGSWHNIAATEHGDVCAWGWNESGQLGFPARTLMDHRRRCKLEDSCGTTRGEASAALPGGAGGDVAVDSVSIAAEPKFLDCFPDDMRVEELACGDRHSVLLTENHEIYVWGYNEYGQLGLGDCCPRDRPQLIPLPLSAHPNSASKSKMKFSVRAGGWNTCILVGLSEADS